MIFYTYLYCDPKNGTPIYVGKGKELRVLEHFKKNTRLGKTLRKRIREGYNPQAIIHYEVDEHTALEMEKFWINQFGREDLGRGTLFNLTDGGDGCSGRACNASTKTKIAKSKIGKKFKFSKAALLSIANKEKLICPHCNNSFDVGNANRWHFDKCKKYLP